MSASRSRQKRKLEPISIEELAGATGMSGFCTFLTRDPLVPVPVLDQFEKGAPETLAPVQDAPVITAVDQAAPDAAPIEEAALDSRYGVESSAPESAALQSDAAESNAADFRYRRRPRIREAHTVQDGHSLAEQAVYETMYASGKPYRDESRILTIGLRTLAELSRMAYSNCKANVRSLVAKKAIDELPGFSYTDGRTYIIHGYSEILRRRKEAGLTHVLRTRGVAFVNPQSDAPESSAPDSTAPPNLESSAPESILAALRRHDPEADEAAAAALWRLCRAVEPAAATDEVIHFIGVKAGKSSAPMPLGFLLSAVPRCFQGDPIRQFRQQRRDRQIAAEILRNPAADEEQRDWARSLLGPEAT
jgi:hypothetical protein